MKIGDRVCLKSGGVGIIEEIDDNENYPTADVRMLTPDNVPSVVITMCRQEDLILVGNNVLPQPRSKKWKAESKEFCKAIENICVEHFKEEV